MSGKWCWFVMRRRKNDQTDNSGLKNDDSINEPQKQSTCNNIQMSTNTVTMSSGLIGNVSQLSLDGNLSQN